MDREAWHNMPPEHALMRTTLRVLSQEEIARNVGVGFDVILDTVNSFEAAILARRTGQPDPILYFYEDFLQVFDPAARERYGVYYMPVEVVIYMVAALDRALRENLRAAGLVDDEVTLLDPAAGTGTFLLGVIEHVRRSVESGAGPGAAPKPCGRYPRGCSPSNYLSDPMPLLIVGSVTPWAPCRLISGSAFSGRHAREPGAAASKAGSVSSPKISAPSGTKRIASNKASRFSRSSAIRLIGGWRRVKSANSSAIGWTRFGTTSRNPCGPRAGPISSTPFPSFRSPSGAGRSENVRKRRRSSSRRGGLYFQQNFFRRKAIRGLRKMLRERFDHIEIIDLRGDMRRGERAGGTAIRACSIFRSARRSR